MLKDYFATQQWVEERLGAGKMVVDIAASNIEKGASVTLPYVTGATMALIKVSYTTAGTSASYREAHVVLKGLKSSGNTAVPETSIISTVKYSVSASGEITLNNGLDYTAYYTVTYYA